MWHGRKLSRVGITALRTLLAHLVKSIFSKALLLNLPVESTAFAQPSMHYDVTRRDQSQASTQMTSLSF